MYSFRYRVIILVITLSLQHICTASAQDYRLYHQNIIKAEEQIFINNQIKEGLNTYLNTFSSYDFVFVSDCVTAIQIALLDSNAKIFLAITDIATKNGLMPRHLNRIPYIKKHPLYIKYTDSVIGMCKRNRPHYLKNIDTTALKKMYSLFAFDQMEKNPMKNESHMATANRYKHEIAKTMGELKQLVLEKGWPSDKLIGIGQTDIMKELKTGTPDMLDFVEKYKDVYPNHNFGPGQFQIQEYELASTFFFPVMAHYSGHYGFVFFDDSIYLQQIKAGYLHPKDIAYVLEFPYRNYPEDKRKPDIASGGRYFGVSRRTLPDYVERPFPLPKNQMDELRKKFFIAPYDQDRAKFRFAREHGMYISWGYMGSRS